MAFAWGCLGFLMIENARGADSTTLAETATTAPEFEAARLLSLNMGYLFYQVGTKSATGDAGNSAYFGSFHPWVGADLAVALNPFLSVTSRSRLTLGYYFTPLSEVGPDEAVTKKQSSARLTYSYQIFSSKSGKHSPFSLTAGVGYWRVNLVGKGGAVTLNNGNGSQGFYLPERTVTTTNWSALLGFTQEWTHQLKGLRSEMLVWIISPFGLKRTLSVSWSVGYAFF